MEMIEIFTRYIVGTVMFDELTKENAKFMNENRRSWTQQELSAILRNKIEHNFTEYIHGTSDEQIILNEIFTDIPYFGLACSIYPQLYNATLIYREGQADMVIDINSELQSEYDSREKPFFENNLLNYK